MGVSYEGSLIAGRQLFVNYRTGNKAAGERVLVPSGAYVSGVIHLHSYVELHLSGWAKILFSTDRNDYLPVVRTCYDGSELYNYSPLIYTYEQENIMVTGNGLLEG